MSLTSDITKRLTEMAGSRDMLSSLMDEWSAKKDKLEKEALILERARFVIQQAAKLTQEQLEYRVSELVSLAMAQIFTDPYKLVLRFENKRGRTEASILFQEPNGTEIEPMEASGGGAQDVASLALRISLWSMQNPRTRSVLILDEPFKFLHGKREQERVSSLIRELSQRLKLQIIIVTQEEWGLDSVDRLFRVTRDKPSPSVVEMVEGEDYG